MKWLPRQLQHNAGAAFRISGAFGWDHLSLDPIQADVLVCRDGHGAIELVAHGPVKLLFHTHAWCGAIYLQVNGAERVESLYSAAHGFREVVIEAQPGASHIVIRTGAPLPDGAQGVEVWLAAVDLEPEQAWHPRSLPVSSSCMLTRGECGTYLTLIADNTIGASIVKTGVWAPRDVAYFRSVIQPGMTVLDIGANIGHHTVLYASLVGPAGRVIAFEPQAVIYRLLCGNLAINGCQQVEAVQTCVGEAEGTVRLVGVSYAGADNFGALGVDVDATRRGDTHGELCRVATLDQLLAERLEPIERCDFIKIDVQSFELFVLKGGRRTLDRFRPVLFLEISPHWMARSHYDYREIYHLLWDLGYAIEHPTDPSVGPREIKPWSGRESEEWDIVARPARGQRQP
jgi:FkbM family methyltransferase